MHSHLGQLLLAQVFHVTSALASSGHPFNALSLITVPKWLLLTHSCAQFLTTLASSQNFHHSCERTDIKHQSCAICSIVSAAYLATCLVVCDCVCGLSVLNALLVTCRRHCLMGAQHIGTQHTGKGRGPCLQIKKRKEKLTVRRHNGSL